LGIADSLVQEARQRKWFRKAATITIGSFVIGVMLYYAAIEGLRYPAEDPDFQVARQLVEETLPGSRVYALGPPGGKEALAWIGHQRIQVVDLDVDPASATAALQGAPTGSYLVITSPERTALESGSIGPRLHLLKEVQDRKITIFLFRIVDARD
jgi:hypothetical protein